MHGSDPAMLGANEDHDYDPWSCLFFSYKLRYTLFGFLIDLNQASQLADEDYSNENNLSFNSGSKCF